MFLFERRLLIRDAAIAQGLGVMLSQRPLRETPLKPKEKKPGRQNLRVLPSRALPIPAPQAAPQRAAFLSRSLGNRAIICSSDASGFPVSWGKDKTEPKVVVAVRRIVVVAIRDAAVLRLVVPAAAAVHAVRAPLMIDRSFCCRSVLCELRFTHFFGLHTKSPGGATYL
jgi:hypothetical protein